jgi:hypothetical protein
MSWRAWLSVTIVALLAGCAGPKTAAEIEKGPRTSAPVEDGAQLPRLVFERTGTASFDLPKTPQDPQPPTQRLAINANATHVRVVVEFFSDTPLVSVGSHLGFGLLYEYPGLRASFVNGTHVAHVITGLVCCGSASSSVPFDRRISPPVATHEATEVVLGTTGWGFYKVKAHVETAQANQTAS